MWNQDHHIETDPGAVRLTPTATAGGRGWFGTVQAGCDYQFASRWVVGVFGDYDFSRIKGEFNPVGTLFTGTETLRELVGGRWPGRLHDLPAAARLRIWRLHPGPLRLGRSAGTGHCGHRRGGPPGTRVHDGGADFIRAGSSARVTNISSTSCPASSGRPSTATPSMIASAFRCSLPTACRRALRSARRRRSRRSAASWSIASTLALVRSSRDTDRGDARETESPGASLRGSCVARLTR